MEIEYLYLLFFIVIIVTWVIGVWKNNIYLNMLAGMFMTTLGLYTFVTGIPGVTTTLTWFEPGNSYAWVFYASVLLIFLGLFIFLTTAYEAVWGIKEAEEGEDD